MQYDYCRYLFICFIRKFFFSFFFGLCRFSLNKIVRFKSSLAMVIFFSSFFIYVFNEIHPLFSFIRTRIYIQNPGILHTPTIILIILGTYFGLWNSFSHQCALVWFVSGLLCVLLQPPHSTRK
jgi:hypothetical protein